MDYGKIQEYKRNGLKKSQVARRLEVDYKTVLKYWDMSPEEYAEAEQSSKKRKKADAYKDFVVECLTKYPDMSAAQVYDRIKERTCLETLDFQKHSLEGNLFFQLISELQEQTSIVITTNKGFEEWAEFLDDAALATAILDRLSYRYDRIQMSWKSYRLENRKSFLNKGELSDVEELPFQ